MSALLARVARFYFQGNPMAVLSTPLWFLSRVLMANLPAVEAQEMNAAIQVQSVPWMEPEDRKEWMDRLREAMEPLTAQSPRQTLALPADREQARRLLAAMGAVVVRPGESDAR